MRWRDEDGSSAVEFALVTPVLLLFLLGIFDFGRAWHAYNVATESARVGARMAALAQAPTVDSIRSAVRNSLSAGSLNPDQATITVTGLGGAPGSAARVEVEYNYSFLFWRSSSASDSSQTSLHLETAAVMRRE
jgi:Flp pilus assembly protein TadG